MRSVFQEQPDVAHVYLGSRRHTMARVFNDENEPFWLPYALWEVTPAGRTATEKHFQEALARVLHSENAHFLRIWETSSRGQRVCSRPSPPTRASSHSPPPTAAATTSRGHRRPALAVRAGAGRAIEPAGDGYRIAEPFLAEWVRRRDL